MARKLKIVFASHTYMGGPFVVGSHHLAKELSKQGHDVYHISTPISPFHLLKIRETENKMRFKRYFFGEKTIQMNNHLQDILVWSMVPWQLSTKQFAKNGRNLSLSGVKKTIKKNNIHDIDILFIDQPSLIGIEEIIKPKVLIFRPTDLNEYMTGDPAIGKAEALLVERADGIVATSMPVLEKAKEINQIPDKPFALIENGVEYEHFLYHPKNVKERTDSLIHIVYVGALDERFDFDAIKHIVDTMEHIKLTVIGPINDRFKKKIYQHERISYLGAKKYSELPPYLHNADIAILPLSDHPSNNGRSPMKLYEFGAAGLHVVVRKTDEIKRRKLSFVHMYDDYREIPALIEQIDLSTKEKIKTAKLSEPYSWRSNAEKILRFCEGINYQLPHMESEIREEVSK
jgi:hypothetical protein